MSQANIPNITPTITLTRDDAINILLTSIGLEEIGLSHIINAEGEKIQHALAAITGSTGPSAINDILNINDSVRQTLDSITRKEVILAGKLNDVIRLFATND